MSPLRFQDDHTRRERALSKVTQGVRLVSRQPSFSVLNPRNSGYGMETTGKGQVCLNDKST